MRRMWAVVLLLALLLGGASSRTGAVAAGSQRTPAQASSMGQPSRTTVALAPGVPNRRVLGYYVPYDPASWASLEAHADQIDIVAAQWVTVDGCGRLSSQDDQTLKRLARERGVQVLPTLLTNSTALNHRILTDGETSA